MINNNEIEDKYESYVDKSKLKQFDKRLLNIFFKNQTINEIFDILIKNNVNFDDIIKFIEFLYVIFSINNFNKNYLDRLKYLISTKFDIFINNDNFIKLYNIFSDKNKILNVFSYTISSNKPIYFFDELVEYLLNVRKYYQDETALFNSFMYLYKSIEYYINTDRLDMIKKTILETFKNDKTKLSIFDCDNQEIKIYRKC